MHRAIHDIADTPGGERIMLVMLPGAKNTPEELVEYGFIRAVRERGFPVDVMAVDAHLGYYTNPKDIEGLLRNILASVQVRGYRRIWLLGISLGGLGAMVCATEYAADIEGVVLLAPFLGTRGFIAEVARAGGLQVWHPGEIRPEDDERALLARIKNYQHHDPAAPRIYLGYGTDDRYASASALLAECLPSQRVMTVSGGHDWPTWITLWSGLLDREPFAIAE